MRRILFGQLLLAGLATYAQTKAPNAVTASFTKQFPNASNVKWGKENAKEYEANFKLNGISMSANYDLNGGWKETETEIAVTDLPLVVSKSIKTKYPDAIISGADKIEKSDGKIIYEADIKSNGKKKEIELYEDGKFVK
ncbi:MAG: PepSY-like domain-containing protein [Bacteroidetes bacterium]|nr:PepSY-like domain-containing protein [Bacteroidota bacterium]